MRKALALLPLVGLGLGLSPLARAACGGVYDTGTMLDDLVMVEDAIRNGDGATSRQVADKIEAGLPCMSEPIPFMIVGRVFRGIAAGKTLGGDEAGGRGWFLTALEVDPTFEYGIEDLAADSPMRFTVQALREEAEVSPDTLAGKELIDGTHYLDGSLLGGPRATPGRPHLYQSEATGAFESTIIQGNAFPATALTGAAVADAGEGDEDGGKKPKKDKKVKEPKTRPPPDTNVESGFYERKRPPEKTPLMIGGGAVLAGSGVVYFLATQSRSKFDDATTVNDVEKYQSQTNTLVIASAAVLAVGAGVLTWGIILDDGGRPLPGVNVRF